MSRYQHSFIRSDGVNGTTTFDGWSAESCADREHHTVCQDERTLYSAVIEVYDNSEFGIRSQYCRDRDSNTVSTSKVKGSGDVC